MEDRGHRVAQFAAKMRLDTTPRRLRQQIPGRPISFRTERDAEMAQNMLADAKSAKIDASRWRWIFARKSTRTTFGRTDVSVQLQSAVKSADNLGLVEVFRDMLLEREGNINYLRQRSRSWTKIILCIDQREQRSNNLALATATGDISLVQLLVNHSDQTSLDESLDLALPYSIQPKDLLIPELLLSHGADGSRQSETFVAALDSHKTSLMALLLYAPKPVSHETVSGSLLPAVRLGFLDALFPLVLAGADGNGANGNGTAVKEAVRIGRQDLLIALTLCNKAPTSQNLDEGVAIANSVWINEPLQQGTLMELLLSNGARGHCSDSTLLAITAEYVAQRSSIAHSSLKAMMALLVCHEASINHDKAAALKICVSNTRIDLIDILLRSKHLERDLASETFAQIDTRASPQQNLDIASKLLKRGAHGIPLHEALIYAVATNHVAAVEMLLSHNNPNFASVDYRDAQALKDAVSREKLLIVDILLEAAPKPQSLGHAFPHIRKTSREGRLRLSKSLLDHGARGLEVDRALAAAIADDPPMRDERLLQLLVDNGAAVDPHICPTASRGDEVLLKIILKGRPSACVTSPALVSALQLPEAIKRLSVLGLLLNSGADINYDKGKVILEATRAFHLPSLDLLLQFSPHPSSLNAAFALASAMNDMRIRYDCTKRLLNAGATGNEVHKALISAVAATPPSLDLLKLIIPHASIDYQDGRALCIAISKNLQGPVSLLLAMKPNSTTFGNAFMAACALRDVQMELKYCKLLLEAGPEEDVASKTLVMAVKNQKVEISRLLLRHGASADFENGASVLAAVTSANVVILKLLVGSPLQRPSVATVTTGFTAALGLINGSAKQEVLGIILTTGVRTDSLNNALLSVVKSERPDCPTINTLLKYGASIYYNRNESLLVAAKRRNIEALKSLLQYANDDSAVSLVFSDRFGDATFHTTALGLRVMEMLLKKGAKGKPVNEAFIKAVTQYGSEPLAKEFAALLLENGADVNFKKGLALQKAAQMGAAGASLIRDILQKECNKETLSLALPFVINSEIDEQTATVLAKQFANHRNQRFRRAFIHPEFREPLVVLCFERFPRSLDLLVSVLDAGFPVDQAWPSRYGDQNVVVTPLFWVLSRPDSGVDSVLIEHLVSRGAALHGHPEPLIHLAIAAHRPTIVQSLILANVELDVKDKQERTPLAHATDIGDVDCMQALLRARTEVNDGALHLAARTLNVNAINLLIANGHNPNQPSIKHKGRTPLAELCLLAPKYAKRSSNEALEKDARKAIQTLIDEGAKTNIKIPHQANGRSLLLHALNSAKPYVMTKAFLDCGQFHHIHQDFNLFTAGEYTYSPTQYVEKGLCKSDSRQHPQLITLLKQYGAQDRFWRHKGEQPEDMKNPPVHVMNEHLARVAELERRKKLRDEQEFQAAMKAAQLRAELERKEREYEFQKSQEEDSRARELTYRADADEMAFRAASRNAHLKQQAIESELQAAANYKNTMGEIDLNLKHRANCQVLAYEDGMYGRKERQLRLDERAWASEEQLVNRRIELGRETRRVAAMQMEWRGGGGGPVLGQRIGSYGQLANRNQGRLMEM